MEISKNEAIEKALKFVHGHNREQAETIAVLAGSVEEYEELEFPDRMKMAARLLSRYSSSFKVHELPSDSVFMFEADLADGEDATAQCYVGYQPEKWRPTYGDSIELVQKEEICVAILLKSDATGHTQVVYPVESIIFERVYEGGNRVVNIVKGGFHSSREVHPEQDAQFIAIVDEASKRIIKEKLQPERARLGVGVVKAAKVT